MINFKEARGSINATKFVFFDYAKLWSEYCKQFPDRIAEAVRSPEDRFVPGQMKTIEVFSKAIEYIPRSLKGRPKWHYFARELVGLLSEEHKYRVLDYGAGAGNMGTIFAMLGFQTDFLEVEGVLTDFLKWRVDKYALTSKVFSQNDNIGTKTYDLISFLDVLEHLDEPLETLEKITKALVKGGYLFISFNSEGKNLDVVSWDRFNQELKPYIEEHFVEVADSSSFLYRKK